MHRVALGCTVQSDLGKADTWGEVGKRLPGDSQPGYRIVRLGGGMWAVLQGRASASLCARRLVGWAEEEGPWGKVGFVRKGVQGGQGE